MLTVNEDLIHYLEKVSDLLIFKLDQHEKVYYCNNAAMSLLKLVTDSPMFTLRALGLSLVDKAPYPMQKEGNNCFLTHYHFSQAGSPVNYMKGFLIYSDIEQIVIMERYKITDVQSVKSVADDNIKLAEMARELAKKNRQLDRASKQINNLALQDSLTELLNRRAFYIYLKETIERSVSSSNTFGVVMLDLDFFKVINDTFGHLAGDKILMIVAETLRNCINKGDFVGRIGGEEFALILNSQSIDVCFSICENIRIGIEALTKDDKKLVTASMGLTLYRAGDTEDSLMKRADHGLYFAKSIGRNRVVVEF